MDRVVQQRRSRIQGPEYYIICATNEVFFLSFLNKKTKNKANIFQFTIKSKHYELVFFNTKILNAAKRSICFFSLIGYILTWFFTYTVLGHSLVSHVHGRLQPSMEYNREFHLQKQHTGMYLCKYVDVKHLFEEQQLVCLQFFDKVSSKSFYQKRNWVRFFFF